MLDSLGRLPLDLVRPLARNTANRLPLSLGYSTPNATLNRRGGCGSRRDVPLRLNVPRQPGVRLEVAWGQL